MKELLNPFTSKSKTNTENQTTLTSDSILMASDDVHRIAMRNPSLYQTKSVPSVGGLSGSRGMA